MQATDDEPDKRHRVEPKKAMRIKDGCVARASNNCIVLVTSVEKDEVLVASEGVARKRGICVLRFCVCGA